MSTFFSAEGRPGDFFPAEEGPGGGEDVHRAEADEPITSADPEAYSRVVDEASLAESEGDDPVHIDEAARALGVSRRTVERMIDRGQLERDTVDGSRTALVTRQSLVEALKAKGKAPDWRAPVLSRHSEHAARQGDDLSRQGPGSEASVSGDFRTAAAPEVMAAFETIERLTDALVDEAREKFRPLGALAEALIDERRQLLAAAEKWHEAERELDHARLEIADLDADRRRLESELDSHWGVTDKIVNEITVQRDELRMELKALADAGPIRVLRLRRRLRRTLRGDG